MGVACTDGAGGVYYVEGGGRAHLLDGIQDGVKCPNVEVRHLRKGGTLMTRSEGCGHPYMKGT